MHRRGLIRSLTALGIAALTSIGAALPAHAAPAEPVPGYHAMGEAPEGSNDWNCKPNRAHPRPVVLVHGTNSSMQATWPVFSPMLKREGFCVFALNYGKIDGADTWGNASVKKAAGELAVFIDAVLKHTGAPQVDIAGHSQGGMMPRLYLKSPTSRIPGTDKPKIRTLVGFALSNHGTTFAPEQSWFDQISDMLSVRREVARQLIPVTPAVREQMNGSDLIKEVNAGGETEPLVQYTVIASHYDEVVQPPNSSFLKPAPNVRNIWVQAGCPTNRTRHGMTGDARALWIAMTALDPKYRETHRAPCSPE